MSSEEYHQELLQTLREIRDAQRQVVELLAAQRALVEEQLKRSRASVEESIALQRIALSRQRTITFVALPGILACIAAIAYLVLRYF